MDDKYYREKFKELGLSEQFEFVERDYSSYKGRKVIVRCKSCGAEFKTWGFNEMLKGRQSHLLCIECGAASDGADVWERSPRCDEAMAYYTDGHTVRQTAEKFGVPESQINNSVKKRGLTNGRQWGEISDEQRERQRYEAEQRLIERLDVLGFDYLGGFTVMAEKVAIKCRTCGDVFERTADFSMHGNLICRKCEHEKTIAEQNKQRMLCRAAAEKRRIWQDQVRQRAEAQRADALFHLLNDKTHTCIVCGKSFSIAEYMGDCGLKQIQHDPSYCSDACKRRAKHRKSKECKKRSGNFDRGNHRHRARKYGVAYEPGITLKKVWKQNNGMCQICGKPCDWSDHSWNEHCGPLYPSIDHVIALANGGGHVWSNVQLAHMMCNSEKGAT